jgi:hypothetical protein
MSILQLIPAQVYFLVAGAAVLALLADTAMRSWHSPERVADPAFMWPRPAPARADYVIGPRLPGGEFRMPEPGLRLGWGPGGSFFEDVEMHPVPRPPVAIVPDAGAAFWSQADDRPAEVSITLDNTSGVFTPHEGASWDWSPLAEHAAADEARLPLDDVDEWLAERVRRFEHELSRIEARTVSLVKGERCRTLDDELQAFVDGSQQLGAYRRLRIGDTGEMSGEQIRRALARV